MIEYEGVFTKRRVSHPINMSERIAKINSVLLHALGNIILLEHNHPSFQMISVTKVETSKDLSVAKVYVSSLKNRDELLKYLEKLTPVIRKKMAERIELRIMPKLTFHLDMEKEYLNKIENILCDL